VSWIVAFTVKNIAMIILIACLVGRLGSSPVEIKNKAQSLKTAWAYAWAGINTGMGWFEYQQGNASSHARLLTRATILGTLCINLYFGPLIFCQSA